MTQPLRKTHSTTKAMALVERGWIIAHKIFDPGDSEPCEYILRWDHQDPVPFNEFSVVRIVSLGSTSFSFEGKEGVAREPRIGDIGAIVHCHPRSEEGNAYEVESVSSDGQTVWVATFLQRELVLVESEHNVGPNSSGPGGE